MIGCHCELRYTFLCRQTDAIARILAPHEFHRSKKIKALLIAQTQPTVHLHV